MGRGMLWAGRATRLDSHKNKEWQDYPAATAAAYAVVVSMIRSGTQEQCVMYRA